MSERPARPKPRLGIAASEPGNVYFWERVVRDCPPDEAEAIARALVVRVQEYALSESDEALVDLCYAVGDLHESTFRAFDRAKERARIAFGCRCGRAWEGHPEPHVSDCALFGRPS